jgi:hypothetical protein
MIYYMLNDILYVVIIIILVYNIIIIYYFYTATIYLTLLFIKIKTFLNLFLLFFI